MPIAVRAVAARRADPTLVEQGSFAIVASQLSPPPLSKLAVAARVSTRVRPIVCRVS